MKNTFFLVGIKKHKQIPYWINAADIFVLPSLIEANPTVMYEALGCGKPFIGTSVGSVPEIIHSDDIGMLCPPTDSTGLSNLISMAMNMEWSSDKIVNYARSFSWHLITKNLIIYYDKYCYK